MGNLTCFHFCRKSATWMSAKREEILPNSTITNPSALYPHDEKLLRNNFTFEISVLLNMAADSTDFHFCDRLPHQAYVHSVTLNVVILLF